MRQCSIDGCGMRHKMKGYCHMHYKRFLRHGDPLKTLRTPEGEPMRYYVEEVLSYEGDECLIWPYTRIPNGYGQLRKDGRMMIVSRVLCEDANGPPPSPEYQAAHSCGNGRKGCVNKRHLSWKTALDNTHDKVCHGTQLRGSQVYQAKLSEEQAREILSLKGVERGAAMARRFGVSETAVYSILNGRSWVWLSGDKGTQNAA